MYLLAKLSTTKSKSSAFARCECTDNNQFRQSVIQHSHPRVSFDQIRTTEGPLSFHRQCFRWLFHCQCQNKTIKRSDIWDMVTFLFAPHRSVFYRPDALPAAQPTASKHWRQVKCVMRKFAVCHTHTQPFNSLLTGTTRVGGYQKKHSPTHTHPNHRTSFIIFLHLQRSTASSLFGLRAWQSSRTTSLQILFLPLFAVCQQSYIHGKAQYIYMNRRVLYVSG